MEDYSERWAFFERRTRQTEMADLPHPSWTAFQGGFLPLRFRGCYCFSTVLPFSSLSLDELGVRPSSIRL